MQQTDQNTMDDRKAALAVTHRIKAVSNDFIDAELDFNKAHTGHVKDTAPCPIQINYLDIKDLSEANKSKLLTVCKENSLLVSGLSASYVDL